MGKRKIYKCLSSDTKKTDNGAVSATPSATSLPSAPPSTPPAPALMEMWTETTITAAAPASFRHHGQESHADSSSDEEEDLSQVRIG